MKPRLLDLFCGAGGAAVGYARAGFEVVGVDINPQPRYPFEFLQANVFDLSWGDGSLPVTFDGTYIDAIHASPPCQAYTASKRRGDGVGDGYGDLIAEVRGLLWAAGLPWVMENVEGAPLRSPLMLCGSMFDPPLDVRRHRYFETDWPLDDPPWPCRHKLWAPRFPAATNRATGSRRTVEVGVWRIPLETQKRAMGVDWDVTLEELSEAVPPRFTEFVGAQLMAHLEANPVSLALTRRAQ